MLNDSATIAYFPTWLLGSIRISILLFKKVICRPPFQIQVPLITSEKKTKQRLSQFLLSFFVVMNLAPDELSNIFCV